MANVNKIVGKYRKIPVQARASFWFLVCGIIQNGLSVITLPIFTRVLTTEQYGLSSTYFAWNDLLVVFCTLRLSYGVFDKGMITYSERKSEFISSLLGLTTTISFCITLVFLFFHKFVEQFLGLPFILCFSLFSIQIFSPALLFWTARNKFEYRYKEFTLVTLCSAICCTFLNLLCVLWIPYDRGKVKILSYQAIWFVVYFAIYIYIFVKGKKFYNKDIWKYALKFNIPLIPYFLSTLILDKADRIMIDQFCGKRDVALYSVSYNLGRLMVLLTSAIDATFTPWFYLKLKSNNLSNTKKISISIMICFLVVSFMFMLLAPELITIFAAHEYKEAVYIIPPVVASYFFVMLYGLVSKVEFYFETTKSIAVITFCAALTDVAANYLAIPIWGYVAAGYTTLISYMLMALGHFALAKKLSKSKGIHDGLFPWNVFVLLGIVVIVITCGVNYLYSKIAIRYTILLVILLCGILFRNKIKEIVEQLKK